MHEIVTWQSGAQTARNENYIAAKALATAAAGLALPLLWFGEPGVAVSLPAKVRSLSSVTLTYRRPEKLNNAPFDSVH